MRLGIIKASFASALGFAYTCPVGHIYACASAKLTNKFDVLLSALAICCVAHWKDARVAEEARLESV